MSVSLVTEVVGRVFDVQRFSIHDGPGIRTTVFLKGCPLRCLWCHNPEAKAGGRQLSYLAQHCIACGTCVEACPRGAHSLDTAGLHRFDRSRCETCGACVEGCWSGALEMVGRDATVAQVLAEVLRDRPFYEHSGGGLTISGGEPLAQLEFTAALLAAAKAEGLHTAIETCGLADWPACERLLGLVDLFLFDLKEMDEERHVTFTAGPLPPIVDNLRRLHDAGAAILVRLPLIPTLNARPDHLARVAELVRSLPRLLGVEIMPYHRLGEAKRERLGLPPAPTIEPPSSDTVAQWAATLRELGVRVVNLVAQPSRL
jgi:pyruvate formate lyase activating enzyme